MKDKADAVKCLYRQRDKFILIGLTGRTERAVQQLPKFFQQIILMNLI